MKLGLILRLFYLLILTVGLFLWSHTGGYSLSGEVHIIQLNDDTINPVTAEYIIKAIEEAEKTNAEALIIKLDTPGGLLNSTRLIVKHILAARVPVVVYIAPGGSRAGSAGVFITYASHIAAMAPSTNIGAAHPVQMGQEKKEDKEQDFWDGFKELMEKREKEARKQAEDQASSQQSQAPVEEKSKEEGRGAGSKPSDEAEEALRPDSDPMSSKILQDTVAFIRAMAHKRGRNVEWAVKSVTKSSSITETEAQTLGVVEIIAEDDQDLLIKLDGRTVAIHDRQMTLATKEASLKYISMDARQKFFNVLANPNIVYILMIIGFYGLLYEVTHPGFGVPGIVGVIFLILAFYSLQTLPTNYAGVALILLGIILFIAEAFVPGFGLFTVGGIIAMALGSFLLFDTAAPMMRVAPTVVLAVTLTTAAITIFLIRLIIQVYRSKVHGGQEGIIGEKGEVYKTIIPGQEGKVYVHGEIWNAQADQEIAKGAKVEVVQITGMLLKVKRL
jgi:membrane-bound serine protease (ClpP class)